MGVVGLTLMVVFLLGASPTVQGTTLLIDTITGSGSFLTTNGAVADGAGVIAKKTGNTVALTASNTRYVEQWFNDNESTLKAAIDTNGNFQGASFALTGTAGFGVSGASQGVTSSGGTTQIVAISPGSVEMKQSNGTALANAKTTGLEVNTLKVPVVHGAGTAAQAIESGSGPATAGNLAITFGTAFSANPNCNCTDTAAVPVPCGISTAANTTSVTFTAAGTDVVQWICIGAR